MPGYIGGRIVRIRVRNFMTYDDLELVPRNSLNLIIGLNGSGKSSVMCAICLGLGGKPQNTGRAAQLSDFIKHGRTSAKVEIELHNPAGKNILICRKIKRDDKSEWLINNLTAAQTEVTAAVKKFNIDIGNLCQFLPQEKVVEFSKMDKKQRLENMLQAIGEPNLFSLFNDLKELRVQFTKLDEDLQKLTSNKESEQQRIQRLKVHVHKRDERNKLKDELTVYKEKRDLLEYEEARHEYKKLESELVKRKEELEVKKHELNEVNSEKSKVLFEHNKFGSEAVEVQNKVSELLKVVKHNLRSLNDLYGEIDQAKIDYKNRLDEKEEQKKRLQELLQQIRGLSNIHAQNMEEKEKHEELDNTLTKQIESCSRSIIELRSDLERSNAEKNRIENNIREYQRESEHMKNEKNKKLEILKQKSRPAYEANLWLSTHQAEFKAKIYPPILLLIEVHSDENRKYIENHIGMRDLLAFVCEDKEDCKRLTNILTIQKKLAVNIVMAPQRPLSSYKPRKPLNQELSQLGVACFLKDLFTAPDPVMSYLCACYYVYDIPICSSEAEKNSEQILSVFPKYFTPNAKISGKRSKYGNKNFTSRRDPISDRNLLTNSGHDERLRELEKNIQESIQERESFKSKSEAAQLQMSNFEMEQEKLRTSKRAVYEKLRMIRSTESQLKQKKALYKQKESNVINAEEEKTKVSLIVQNSTYKRINIMKNQHSKFKEILSYKKEKAQIILFANSTFRRLSIINEKSKTAQSEFQNIQTEVEDFNSAVERAKANAVKILKKVKMFLNNNKELKKNIYDHLPNSLKKLDEAIIHMETQLDLNSEEDEAAVLEYEERLREVAKIETSIEERCENLKKLKDIIDAKKNIWLPSMQFHVNNINKRFSQYYKSLNCAGEISLDTSDNPDDFPKYGLQIRLKYREDEPLMELSQTHHSGGECSVAAIMFILSLQELTEVPFRCIDEINQGMDSINERKIYNLIAKSAASGSCSQYFLLTPKLLMNLSFHRDVAVHVIYNSCFLDTKMNVQDHLKRARACKE